MIAIAANSPLLGGEFTGWQSTRQRVWSQLDSARCGPILGASGDDPASDWARYALKAPVMLVHPTPEIDAVPITDWVPFADWADGRVLLGGRRPTAGRPGLSPDHAVPAGAAAALAGDPLPRQRARRGVARRGVHARHAARRPGRRRHRRRSHRDRRHGVGPRRAGRPRRPAAARGRHPVRAGRRRTRPRRARRNRCSSWCVRSRRDDARPTTSPTAWSKYGIAAAVTAIGARGAVTARETLARELTRPASARCGWSSSTTPSCAASTTR